MATRKTSKFYREELIKKNQPLSVITELVKEVISKYGKDNCIYIKDNTFNWNHQVTGFMVSKGILYVNVYWQGDDTDGYEAILFADVYNKGKVTIKAKHFFDGCRTRCTHSDINVEKNEIIEMLSHLSNYLSPSAIKERKLKEDLSKLKSIITNKLGNEYFTKYAHKWGDNEEYHNGYYAVLELLKNKEKEFVTMPIDKVLEIVDIVFKKNYKSKRYFGGDRFRSNTKPYDITY